MMAELMKNVDKIKSQIIMIYNMSPVQPDRKLGYTAEKVGQEDKEMSEDYVELLKKWE